MALDPARIQEIRERVEKATSGPWKIHEVHDSCCDYARDWETDEIPDHEPESRGMTCPDGGLNHGEDYELFTEPDATFIAHAREDIPYLLSELDRLGRREARLREALDETLEALDRIPDAVVYGLGEAEEGIRDRAHAALAFPGTDTPTDDGGGEDGEG